MTMIPTIDVCSQIMHKKLKEHTCCLRAGVYFFYHKSSKLCGEEALD